MKNLVLIFSCLMAMSVVSCGDDATVNPPGDGSIPGTIAGHVVLFDEYGDSLSNHGGVAVKLVNENKTYSATTDAAGNYKLEKVIAGIYTHSFEKAGWKKHENRELQFVGNGTLTASVWMQPLKRKSILEGNIVLVDKYGRNLGDSIHLYNGITISITGTNLSTTPDNKGKWKIKGVEEGEISVVATKVGFEKSTVNVSFKHDTVYGQTVRISNQVLIETGTVEVNLLPVKVDTETDSHGDKTAYIYLFGEFMNPQDAGNTSVRIFISDKENMTKDNSDFSWTIWPALNSTYWERWTFLQSYSQSYGLGRFAKEMRDKYPSGSIVYIRAYPEIANVLNPPSNVVSFTMP